MSSITIEGSVRTRIVEIDEELKAIEVELGALNDLRNNLAEARQVLGRTQLLDLSYAGNGHGNGNGNGESRRGPQTGRKIEYEELRNALSRLDHPARTSEIAEALETVPLMIARKIQYLVDHGEVAGDKESGFSLLPQ